MLSCKIFLQLIIPNHKQHNKYTAQMEQMSKICSHEKYEGIHRFVYSEVFMSLIAKYVYNAQCGEQELCIYI